MKWVSAVLVTSLVLLLPAVSYCQGENGAQQQPEKPAVVNPTPATDQIATTTPPQQPDQLQQSMRDHFRACDQALDQARNQAHVLSRDASRTPFDTDALLLKNQKLQEQVRIVKESHEKFLADLSEEQKKSIEDHNTSIQQIHDRIQTHLQAIDQEFSGSELRLTTVSDEAKATEREMKSYQKQLQETGRAFNLLSD